MNSLEYNKSRGYGSDLVKKIQRTVGSPSDGLWGRRTIAQIKRWQRSQGVSADGKIGPSTLEKFERMWAEDTKPGIDEQLDDLAIGEPEDDGDDGTSTQGETSDIGEGFNYFDGRDDLAIGSTGDSVIALQYDLFAFGFLDTNPRRKYNDIVAKAVRAFQTAAASPARVSAYRRVEVKPTFKLSKPGVVDAATRAEIRLWKEKLYWYRAPGVDFVERRVRVRRLGSIPKSSALLRDVPGTGGRTRKLHRLAAEALTAMSTECKAEVGVELIVQSGHRRHRWNSREHYETVLRKKYGSIREGAKWLGYNSAHETGLAADFGSGGLEANKNSIPEQLETPVYAWLVANAFRFGFTPYKREPWHWEYALSYRAWMTGLSDWRLRDDLD